jgi:hypothetical protein
MKKITVRVEVEDNDPVGLFSGDKMLGSKFAFTIEVGVFVVPSVAATIVDVAVVLNVVVSLVVVVVVVVTSGLEAHCRLEASICCLLRRCCLCTSIRSWY